MHFTWTRLHNGRVSNIPPCTVSSGEPQCVNLGTDNVHWGAAVVKGSLHYILGSLRVFMHPCTLLSWHSSRWHDNMTCTRLTSALEACANQSVYVPSSRLFISPSYYTGRSTQQRADRLAFPRLDHPHRQSCNNDGEIYLHTSTGTERGIYVKFRTHQIQNAILAVC